MNAKTPVEYRGLVATRNTNRLVQAKAQHVFTPYTPKYNLSGETVFIITFILTNCTDGLIFQYVDAIGAGTNIFMGRDTDTSVKVRYDSIVNPPMSYFGTDLPSLSTSSLRITLVKWNLGIAFYVNTRLIGNQSFGAFGGGTNFIPPLFLGKDNAGLYTSGAVSNFALVIGTLTLKHLEELHWTNLIPKSMHNGVMLHLQMNEDNGGIVHDTVEKYNYAKRWPYKASTVLTAAMFTQTLSGANVGTITEGSDGDGSYVEFTMTTYIGSGALYWQIGSPLETVGGVIPYTYTVKYKLIGTSRVAFNASFFDNFTFTQAYSSVLGNGINIWTNSGVTAQLGRSFQVSFIAGVTSPLVNSTIRIYSVDASGIMSNNHSDLINYNNEEAGLINPLLQTAWNDLYMARKRGNYFLKLNGTSGYARVTAIDSTVATNWTLFLDVYSPAASSAAKIIFFNQSSDDPTNYVQVGWYEDTLFYYFGSTIATVNIAYSTRYKIVIRGVTADNKTYIDIYDKNNGVLISGNRTGTPSTFQSFYWGKHSVLNIQYNNEGITRSLFTTAVLLAKDLNTILNERETTSVTGIQFDIDFGDIFLNTTYFARDYSGLNRHASLFNFVPATDQPLLINRRTLVPPRKALRFTRASSQHLEVGGFTPSKEKGYSVVCVFGLDTDRNFGGTQNDILWGKRGASFVESLGGMNLLANTQIAYWNGGVVIGGQNYRKTDGLISIGTTWKDNNLTYYDNGIVSTYYGSGSAQFVLGFNTDLSNAGEKLFIGMENGHHLNGYMAHMSIYKGMLTQAEILDIIDLNQPPARIWSDCQLWLNFEAITESVVLNRNTGLALADFTLVQTGTNTYATATGTDGDGAYVEFEMPTWTSGFLFWNIIHPSMVLTREYEVTIRLKLIGTSKIFITPTGGAAHLYRDNVTHGNALLTVNTTAVNTATGGVQIGFNDGTSSVTGSKVRIYSIYVNEGARIIDYSPQDRRAYLRNYSVDEINPVHVDYKLFDTDVVLNVPGKKSYPLPSDVLAKTWGWYDINDRRQLQLVNQDDVTGWYNKLGDTTKDFLNPLGAGASSAFAYRRYPIVYQPTNPVNQPHFYTCKYDNASGGTQGIGPGVLSAKIMNWLHDGTTGWFVSFLLRGAYAFGSPMYILYTQGGGRGLVILLGPGAIAGNVSINTILHTGVQNYCWRYANAVQNLLHHVVVMFDPTLGSANLKVYVDGAETTYNAGTGALLTTAVGGDSGGLPEIFNRQSETTTIDIYAGEMIIGNQVLTGGELTSLFGYYTNKYGVFPKS